VHKFCHITVGHETCQKKTQKTNKTNNTMQYNKQMSILQSPKSNTVNNNNKTIQYKLQQK